VPTIEAFKDTDKLLVVTTGGSETEELKKKYPHNNIIIENFIPFEDIMPHTHVYVSNGGYGGVMQAIQHGLPMVVAGVHEGKNEINARINHFKYGVNIGTETPTPRQVLDAVGKVVTSGEYTTNVTRLQQEFANYDSRSLTAKYLEIALQ
jgi:UDP:flavonoid glycosyltransferase YjiC (YdhE family)